MDTLPSPDLPAQVQPWSMAFEPEQPRVDFWGLIARRKWLILLGLVVGLGLAYLYFTQAQEWFQSGAKIRIRPRNQAQVAFVNNDTLAPGAEALLKRHDKDIASERIVRRCFEDSVELTKMPIFDGLAEDERLSKVIGNLEVHPDKEDGEVFHLSFKATNANDARTMLNAILDTYEQELELQYSSESDRVVTTFKQVKTYLSDYIAKRQKSRDDLYDIARKEGVSDIVVGANNMTLHNSKVADLLHAIEDAKKEVSEIRSEIVWIHAQLTEQTPAQADVSLSGLDAAGRSTASSEAASSASQDSSGMSQEPFGLDSPADLVARDSPPLFNASEQADAASGSDAPAADPNALAQDPIAAAAPGGRETEPTLPASADSDPAKQLAESKQRVESVIGFLRLDNAATDATPRMIQEIFERLRPPGSPHAEQVVLALALVGKITRPNDMQKTRLTPETAALAETSRHRLQLKSQIEQLQVERETKIQDLGAKHPEIQKIDRLLEQYNKSMAEMDATNGFGENTEEQRPYSNEQFIGAYVNTLALSYNNMMTQLPDLVNEFEAHYRRAHRLNEISRQIRDADDEVQMFRQFQEETIATLAQINPRYIDQNFVNNEDEGFKFTELDAPSTGSRVWPNLPLVLGLGGLIGSLFGMCLGYFVDVADKTFHNPDEIMRQLSMPLIGHIPVIPQSKRHVIENSYIDPSICTFHRPKSQASEAFRAIRTALFFSTKGKTNSVIQVTSPTPGDGKSTIAANVAVSIAQSGKRVLLLDSDMRRPTVHHAFGIKTREGFPQVLNGEKTWRSMVYQCEEVPGLSILPCGDKPGNPAELISTPRVGELLEEMRHHYDFIILDTPPVLAVTDPCPVAARVDGVILTIRIKKNVKISSDRATEILHSVGANLIGVVVNGVGTQSGYGSQYSYGAYRAGYQYNGYGYGYGYSYGYGRQSDDEKPVRPSPVRNLNAPESSGAQVN